mmetsp:Transcript_34168/g.113107  ORF Transcript_34168/g.113107 Transcript_34168/m.113107 type:complete len:80 (+) Transcript_34168:2234-2473(+)
MSRIEPDLCRAGGTYESRESESPAPSSLCETMVDPSALAVRLTPYMVQASVDESASSAKSERGVIFSERVFVDERALFV